MKRLPKRMFATLPLIFVLALGFSSTALANAYFQTIDETGAEIAPLWSNIRSITAVLEINNGNAGMTGTVIGKEEK